MLALSISIRGQERLPHVTITLLANYVDMRFLTDHWIHRSGAFRFLPLRCLVYPIGVVLRRTNRVSHTHRLSKIDSTDDSFSRKAVKHTEKKDNIELAATHTDPRRRMIFPPRRCRRKFWHAARSSFRVLQHSGHAR